MRWAIECLAAMLTVMSRDAPRASEALSRTARVRGSAAQNDVSQSELLSHDMTLLARSSMSL